MTLSDSFWSFTRLAESWSSASTTPPKPRRRTAVFTQQHIETIGGGNEHAFKLPRSAPVLGDPRLPVELIVYSVLLAAQEVSPDQKDASARLLELARVSRACHRAVMSMHLLPDLCLYGLHQIRSFAVSLDQDRLGIRALARSRVQCLTLRARSRQSLQHGYGPALFDASQAQTHFEKDLLPFIRVVLSHCHALRALHLEGVPRGLNHHFSRLAPHLTTYDCLMGHYGAEIERDFWLTSRWTQLRHLQLHGPRFRFTPSVATTLACLPQLTRLGLVVPMIVSSPSSPSTESGGIELDMTGSINPLQILIDRCPSLEVLLLVGHAERDYVGFTEKYRHWLRGLRRPRLSDNKVRLELVTALRRASDDEIHGAARTRVHPCEVSAWITGRARHGLQWFEDAQQEAKDGKLDYWTELFELAEHPSNPSTGATTSATSALMSRAGSNSPFSGGAANARIQQQARQQQHRMQVDDAIEAVDMLSEDDLSSDEP